MPLFLYRLGSLSRFGPQRLLFRQGQTPVSSSPVMMMRGRVGLPGCLGEADNVLVTGGFNGTLVPDYVLERATLAARYRRDFVDEMLYLGHLPGGCGRGGKEVGGDGAPLALISVICVLAN